jgi:hypothetical protein
LSHQVNAVYERLNDEHTALAGAIMKPEQVIRDRCSNRVGNIVDNGQQLVARDKFGRNLGYYDKQGNVTRDRNSNRICQGDALSSLILKAAGS